MDVHVLDLRPGLVRCERLRVWLSPEACAARNGARIPSGKARGAFRHPFCALCPVGTATLLRLEAQGWRRPRDVVDSVLPQGVQAAARKRMLLSVLSPSDEVPSRLPPAVELLIDRPEDRGIEADAAGLG